MVFAQLASEASALDQNVTAVLRQLYSQNETANALGAKAKAVLVFPDIKKAAFMMGALYGYGALRKGGQTVGYYRTGAASYGFCTASRLTPMPRAAPGAGYSARLNGE
jgi:lipid-binding SYLF domain-containing protein